MQAGSDCHGWLYDTGMMRGQAIRDMLVIADAEASRRRGAVVFAGPLSVAEGARDGPLRE